VYHPEVDLVLASASPRRAELLAAAGFGFVVCPADVDESMYAGEDPVVYALRVARDKARVVAASCTGAWVIAADTIVVLDGEVFGKPADAADAGRMLRRLSGRTHSVVTGTVVRRGDVERFDADTTQVRFADLSEEDIAWYVASGEPQDKAGAYAIQGLASRFVPAIDGSYGNVVGLPITMVCRLLRELGYTHAWHGARTVDPLPDRRYSGTGW